MKIVRHTLRAGLFAVPFIMGIGALPGHATVIDFESTAPGTVIDTLFAGITFGAFGPSLAGTGPTPPALGSLPIVDGTVVVANLTGSNLGAVSSSPGDGNRGILMTFDSFIASLSLIGADGGGSETADDEDVRLTAFDAAGAVIATNLFAPPLPGGPDLVSASIAAVDIKHVAFTFGDSLGFFGISELEFTALSVPEPGTLSLFGFGLAGLGLIRRRKAAASAT